MSANVIQIDTASSSAINLSERLWEILGCLVNIKRAHLYHETLVLAAGQVEDLQPYCDQYRTFKTEADLDNVFEDFETALGMALGEAAKFENGGQRLI